jgi:hypothetical protein
MGECEFCGVVVDNDSDLCIACSMKLMSINDEPNYEVCPCNDCAEDGKWYNN